MSDDDGDVDGVMCIGHIGELHDEMGVKDWIGEVHREMIGLEVTVKTDNSSPWSRLDGLLLRLPPCTLNSVMSVFTNDEGSEGIVKCQSRSI